MFVLKECILSLASLPAVVRVLALNCGLPLLDSAEGTSCFPGTKYPEQAEAVPGSIQARAQAALERAAAVFPSSWSLEPSTKEACV